VYDISPNGNHARLGKLTGSDNSDPKWIDLQVSSPQPVKKNVPLFVPYFLPQHMSMYFSMYEEKITNFMESVVRLKNDYPDIEEIRTEAIKLANAYGRRHIYKFRVIYEELVEKMQKA